MATETKTLAEDIKSLKQLKVEHLPATSIRPNNYNPNRQNQEEFFLLLKSMDEDGFTQPIVIIADGENKNEIVDGEHRWTAAIVLDYLKREGIALEDKNSQAIADARGKRDSINHAGIKVPCVPVPMSDVQRRVATLRHNRARGSEDVAMLAEMMRDIEKMGALDWAQDSLDMDAEEVERLLAYGDNILDHFPAEAPSTAWEPRQTLPGQVQSWTDDANNQRQYVSAEASNPMANPGTVFDPSVPGLGQLSGISQSNPRGGEAAQAPLMARRIFVMLEDQAKLVDQALGDDPVRTLVQMCKERLGMVEES